MIANRIKGIYDALRSGDNITDGELDYAIAYFKRVSDDLSQLGPIFTLAHHEAARSLTTLEDFKQARKTK